MNFIARLRAVCASVYDYEADYEILSAIPSRTDGLLAMRRIKLRSTVLKRIADAGQPFDLMHCLKRCYRDIRDQFHTLKTPLYSSLKNAKRPNTIRWGGNGCYYDLAPGVSPKKEWRDSPFKRAYW